MSLWLVLAGIAAHALSGVPGLFCRRESEAGQRVATAAGITGSLLGLAGALLEVLRPPPTAPAPGSLFAFDGLSVIFLLPIFLIPALGAIYGLDYWRQSDHPGNGRKLRLFYGLVTAGLALIAVANHAILFLLGWEVMALSAFFLVTTEDEEPAVREVGMVYLVATHLATLCLFALFALLRSATGSWTLSSLAGSSLTPALANAFFLLGFVAFGLKAGVMPLHIWLPGAHAMAPSHVSALMSGVLIKIGIYGMVRLLSLLPDPPLWWGASLLAAGAISGVLGVVFAIGQHDLKRLLAYHSVENIGIIVIGLGLALVGRTLGRADLVVLGLAGGLLHVWNHGLFKSLLFLSAGAAIQATHTREIDRLGGLAKPMPRTALCFAMGAVAICGLPPLNGFVSELLIYLGLFRAVQSGAGAAWAGAALAVPALALIGGLAVACFVKVLGATFLGSPRSAAAAQAREPGLRMIRPMFVLLAFCLFIGLAPGVLAPILDQGIRAAAPHLAGGATPLAGLAPFGWITVLALGLLLLLALLQRGLVARWRSLGATPAVTWDCGYAAPAASMQYTASSFSQMLVQFFSWVLRPRVHAPEGRPLVPHRAHFHSHVPDLVLDGILRPLFRLGAGFTGSLRFLQQGSIHAYLFYIVLFLILLLLWI